MLLLIIIIIIGGRGAVSVGRVIGICSVRIGLVMSVVVSVDESWVGGSFGGHVGRFS